MSYKNPGETNIDNELYLCDKCCECNNRFFCLSAELMDEEWVP